MKKQQILISIMLFCAGCSLCPIPFEETLSMCEKFCQNSESTIDSAHSDAYFTSNVVRCSCKNNSYSSFKIPLQCEEK